jgi:hypothetical protein
MSGPPALPDAGGAATSSETDDDDDERLDCVDCDAYNGDSEMGACSVFWRLLAESLLFPGNSSSSFLTRGGDIAGKSCAGGDNGRPSVSHNSASARELKPRNCCPEKPWTEAWHDSLECVAKQMGPMQN